MDENVIKLDAGNNSKKYKVEPFWDSAIYAQEPKTGHLSGFYSLISWKKYLKEKNK